MIAICGHFCSPEGGHFCSPEGVINSSCGNYGSFFMDSHLPKKCVIGLIESPLKMMKNAFYFILKAFLVLKVFKFLSRLFSHVGKTA